MAITASVTAIFEKDAEQDLLLDVFFDDREDGLNDGVTSGFQPGQQPYILAILNSITQITDVTSTAGSVTRAAALDGFYLVEEEVFFKNENTTSLRYPVASALNSQFIGNAPSGANISLGADNQTVLVKNGNGEPLNIIAVVKFMYSANYLTYQLKSVPTDISTVGVLFTGGAV